MDVYSVVFKKSVGKDFEGVPIADARKIMRRIAALADDPRGPGCEKLAAQDKYRVRQGDWRILYSIRDESRTVCVVKIRHRREAYR